MRRFLETFEDEEVIDVFIDLREVGAHKSARLIVHVVEGRLKKVLVPEPRFSNFADALLAEELLQQGDLFGH